MKKMNKIQILIGAAFLGFCLNAQAIPSLSFFGEVKYDASSGLMSVHSVLHNSEDITPAPTLIGSSLDFTATLDSIDASNPLFTVGLFNGVPGDDITVLDGDSNNLLTGEFSSLMLRGFNDSIISGNSKGQLTGVINATGGSLATMFSPGELIALEFNLTTVFSPGMYRNSFTGFIDGSIDGVAVSEPEIFLLLGLGLALISMTNRKLKSE